MEKKTWTKPELIIVVRTRPEEAVLDLCKTGGQSGQGYTKRCSAGTGNHTQCNATHS
jgi:hypothetical protein